MIAEKMMANAARESISDGEIQEGKYDLVSRENIAAEMTS